MLHSAERETFPRTFTFTFTFTRGNNNLCTNLEYILGISGTKGCEISVQLLVGLLLGANEASEWDRHLRFSRRNN